MSEIGVIKDRIRKKEAEIHGLEEKLRAAKVYVQALQDVLGAIERDATPQPSDASLRIGSSVTLAREAILRAGAPVHISDLLAALGRGITKEARSSLVSSLAAYVRKGDIFTRPAPNTFGLIELGLESGTEHASDEPPSDFGKIPTNSDDEIPF